MQAIVYICFSYYLLSQQFHKNKSVKLGILYDYWFYLDGGFINLDDDEDGDCDCRGVTTSVSEPRNTNVIMISHYA